MIAPAPYSILVLYASVVPPVNVLLGQVALKMTIKIDVVFGVLQHPTLPVCKIAGKGSREG